MTMSFLIKGRDGFTKKLLRKAHRSTEGMMKVTALTEGPFGTTPSVYECMDMANKSRWTSFIFLVWYCFISCRGYWDHASDIISS